jgi:hypothetical protein
VASRYDEKRVHTAARRTHLRIVVRKMSEMGIAANSIRDGSTRMAYVNSQRVSRDALLMPQEQLLLSLEVHCIPEPGLGTA